MNKEIQDEICKCGHLLSEHNNSELGVENHGDCKKCDCKQYTWKEFVYKAELKTIAKIPVKEALEKLGIPFYEDVAFGTLGEDGKDYLIAEVFK